MTWPRESLAGLSVELQSLNKSLFSFLALERFFWRGNVGQVVGSRKKKFFRGQTSRRARIVSNGKCGSWKGAEFTIEEDRRQISKVFWIDLSFPSPAFDDGAFGFPELAKTFDPRLRRFVLDNLNVNLGLPGNFEDASEFFRFAVGFEDGFEVENDINLRKDSIFLKWNVF